jgi:hypothetical protein
LIAAAAAEIPAARRRRKQPAMGRDREGVRLRRDAQRGKECSKQCLDLVRPQAETIRDTVRGRSIGQHLQRISLARCDVKYQESSSLAVLPDGSGP